MVKKIIGFAISALLLLSPVACNPPEEDEVNIPFEFSGKTTDYFDTDEREVLLQIVNSLEKLTQLLSEKEFLISPMYEEVFFEEHALVLFFLRLIFITTLKLI